MKLLSWNCRGLTCASVVRSLKVKVRKLYTDVIFLYETKALPFVTSVIMNNLGFFLMSHVPPFGSKGGVLLVWRNGVDLVCFLTNVNTTNAWCYSNPPNKPWILSCIYRPPYSKNKSNFWDSLSTIGENHSGAWLCIRDFNMIIDQFEKIGGRLFACSSSDPFRLFMNNNGMVYLGFSSNPFTWYNNRDDVHLIKERLDRGLASTQWIHLFLSFSIQHLSAITSNHNPLFLDIVTPSNNQPQPFMFEEFWTRDLSCRNIISAAWSSYFAGSPTFMLSKKLKATKYALKIGTNFILVTFKRGSLL